LTDARREHRLGLRALGGASEGGHDVQRVAREPAGRLVDSRGCRCHRSGGWAFAATSTSSGVIHACVSRHGGAGRVARRCKKSERAISWNAQGIPARRGPTEPPERPGGQGTRSVGHGTRLRTRERHRSVDPLKKRDGRALSRKRAILHAPAAGINPASTGVVATPDFSRDTTEFGNPNADNSAHVEFNSAHPSCRAIALEVDTVEINNANAGRDHYDVEFTDEPFLFVIP
jgi:hypothetical protein